MKSLILVAALVFGSVASAFDFPTVDFSMLVNAQKAAIRADKGVQAKMKKLGAKKIDLVNTSVDPVLYVAETDKGQTFEVEVVYADNFFSGIQKIVVK